MKYLLPCVAVLMLAACRPEAPAPQPSTQSAESPEQVVPLEDEAVPELKDSVETDPRYIIGISYPPEANRYPGLAAALHRYTQVAREELMESVEARGDGSDAAGLPYDLSLDYRTVVSTPSLLAIAADGSMFTGGAHGALLVERFVWLPAQDKALAIGDLFPDAKAWRDISRYVREQLHAALSQRVDADELEPAERDRLVRTSGRMIDEGSGPEEENFSRYEPVMGADGRIHALRFVFPPYQVGPYSDGIQTVEVPASVVLPHVAPEYRSLFAGG